MRNSHVGKTLSTGRTPWTGRDGRGFKRPHWCQRSFIRYGSCMTLNVNGTSPALRSTRPSGAIQARGTGHSPRCDLKEGCKAIYLAHTDENSWRYLWRPLRRFSRSFLPYSQGYAGIAMSMLTRASPSRDERGLMSDNSEDYPPTDTVDRLRQLGKCLREAGFTPTGIPDA